MRLILFVYILNLNHSKKKKRKKKTEIKSKLTTSLLTGKYARRAQKSKDLEHEHDYVKIEIN